MSGIDVMRQQICAPCSQRAAGCPWGQGRARTEDRSHALVPFNYSFRAPSERFAIHLLRFYGTCCAPLTDFSEVWRPRPTMALSNLSKNYFEAYTLRDFTAHAVALSWTEMPHGFWITPRLTCSVGILPEIVYGVATTYHWSPGQISDHWTWQRTFQLQSYPRNEQTFVTE